MNTQMIYWLKLTRPQTLPAAFGGALIGNAAVMHLPEYNISWGITAMIFALVMQVLANIVNDFADGEKGIDGDMRLGPPRMVASGYLPQKKVKGLAIVLSFFGACLTLAAINRLGVGALLLGGVCIAFAWLYSSGVVAFSHKYMGELLAYFFFGLVLVSGTSWLSLGYLDPFSVKLSLVFGGWPIALMAINNCRDIETDREADKNTLAHLIGVKGMHSLILSSWVLAIAGTAALVFEFGNYSWFLIVLMVLPIFLIPKLLGYLKSGGTAMNGALKMTGLTMGAHAVLIAVILIWK